MGSGELLVRKFPESAEKKFRPSRLSFLIVFVLLISLFDFIIAPAARAAACTFPTDDLWVAVKDSSGAVLTDPAADVGSGSNNSDMDIVGTAATASAPAGAAIEWYSTGSAGCFSLE